MTRNGNFILDDVNIREARPEDGKAVYAIVLGWPDDPLRIQSIKIGGDGYVQLLGHDQRLIHRVNDGGQLVIELPEKQIGRHAHALKITGFDMSLSDEALTRAGDSTAESP